MILGLHQESLPVKGQQLSKSYHLIDAGIFIGLVAAYAHLSRMALMVSPVISIEMVQPPRAARGIPLKENVCNNNRPKPFRLQSGWIGIGLPRDVHPIRKEFLSEIGKRARGARRSSKQGIGMGAIVSWRRRIFASFQSTSPVYTRGSGPCWLATASKPRGLNNGAVRPPAKLRAIPCDGLL